MSTNDLEEGRVLVADAIIENESGAITRGALEMVRLFGSFRSDQSPLSV